MRSKSLKSRAKLFAAAQGAVLLLAGGAQAGVTFLAGNSSLKLTHDGDQNSTAVPVYLKNVSPIPSSSGMPIPPSYQLVNTFPGSGAASSVAVGSVGYVANATTASFLLGAGTGVVQIDPNNSFPGASTLKLDVNFVYQVDGSGFGPTAIAYISVPVAFVVGSGGSARYIANFTFSDPTSGGRVLATYSEDTKYTSAGTYTPIFTLSQAMSPSSLTSGQRIKVKGTIDLRANNQDGAVDVLPLNGEFGSAPPTATWMPIDGALWSDPVNWAEGFVPGLSTDPKQIGDRARLLNQWNRRPTGNVILDVPITLSTLDIDGPVPYRIGVSTEPGPNQIQPMLVLDAQDGPSEDGRRMTVLNVRNVYGDSAHNIDVPITLARSVELAVDALPANGLPGLSFNGSIDGTGGIMKLGAGAILLNQTNTYSGGTSILDGEVIANAPGALGMGPVTLRGGQLTLNTAGALPGGAIVIESNSQLNLGFTPTASDSFVVQPLAAIQGSPAELANLQVGENLQLAPGAMIAHEAFSPGSQGNPGGLGNVAQYIFGISADFPGGPAAFTIGTASQSPWRGLGGDRGNRRFGGILLLAGEADLVSIGDGRLDVDATMRRSFTVPIPAPLIKRGAGTVAINSISSLQSPVHVAEGTLLINGMLEAAVSVDPGAVVGGRGTVTSIVASEATLRGGIQPAGLPEGRPIISPGDPAAGTPVGTLTVGNMLLDSALLLFDLNTSKESDRIIVTDAGGLVLDGQSLIHINDLPDFGAGTYPLMDYNGPLSGSIGANLALTMDRLSGFDLNLIDNVGDTRIDLLVTPIPTPRWNVDGGGTWGNAGNWIGGVPDEPAAELDANEGSIANFLASLSSSSVAPAEVLLSGNRTVGTLRFDSRMVGGMAPDSYRIVEAAAGGMLTIDNILALALIAAESGEHEVAVPVHMASSTDVIVEPGAALTLSGPITMEAGRILSKLGDGVATLSGGLELGAGASLSVDKGTLDAGAISGGWTEVRERAALFAGDVDQEAFVVRGEAFVNHLRSQSVLVAGEGPDGHLAATSVRAELLQIDEAGKVVIVKNDGSFSGLGVLEGLEMSDLATLDVSNNALIVQSSGGPGAADLRTIEALIARARNMGAWDEPGITSSEARNDPSGLTGLAVLLNADRSGAIYTEFEGESVDENAVLVLYSLNGDMDLNRIIDIDDYFLIDTGFLDFESGAVRAPTYRQGDLDFNDLVDIDDYFVIDTAFLGQGGVSFFSAGQRVSAAAVPEPAGLGVLVLAPLLWSRRRSSARRR